MRVASVLREVVSNEEETVKVRSVAVESLGMVLQDGSQHRRERQQAGRVLTSMPSNPEPELRFWAAYALGMLRWKPALEELTLSRDAGLHRVRDGGARTC